jgi:hypothetical protein
MELATKCVYSSGLGSEIVHAAAQGDRRWEVLLNDTINYWDYTAMMTKWMNE